MRTNEEYEDMAVALANRPVELGSLKQRLRDNRDKCPLFDSARFTRQIEEAYQQVMTCYWAGREPDHVTVFNPGAQARPSDGNVNIDDFVGNGLSTSRRTNLITNVYCQ
jgi:hypothetical protein